MAKYYIMDSRGRTVSNADKLSSAKKKASAVARKTGNYAWVGSYATGKTIHTAGRRKR